MKKQLLTVLLSAAMIMAYGQSQKEQLIGSWYGKLALPATELRIVFHVKIDENSASGLSGTMDSPDQGAKGIPVSQVLLTEDKIEFKVAAVGGGFVGKITDDNTLLGEWFQGGGKLPLELTTEEPEEEETKRPQDPIPPYPYDQKEVTFPNEGAAINLAGTLTYPKEGGPFTAVILISGSGPQNRDEELVGHKPFLVLSDYLTRQGIAVLRFDERGVGESTGNFATATTEDFAKDVAAAVDYLREQQSIGISKIGLIGHSEGGIVAPMVATARDDIDFIVLMASPGVPGDEILQEQTGLITKANGGTDAQIEKIVRRQGEIIELVKSEGDLDKLSPKIDEWITQTINSLSEEEKKMPQNSEQTLRAGTKALQTPWFRYFLTYDPGPALRETKCAVLAVNGKLDLQVPSKQNLGAIANALKDGGNNQFETKEFPKLNHLFQTATTGSPTEYSVIEETMAPQVMRYIGDWVKKQ